ncbi:sensor histidine kinase [Plantactinospora sp. S1510]|uniref:histidine kinase n=1 Tax=Plantactinospora alkalitolerans TaxID=2789879 RepID=A0ABS0HAW7_9ACTN|nr:histidine kinase [Plantactinospora alkalitolerans]MBF9135464.1 sensor histidine kinase [Plantactinospora alkalitolerans]
MSWLASRRWLAFDAVLAVGLVVVSVEQGDNKGLQWWLFTVPMVAGLLVGRRWPVPAAILAGVGVLGHHLPYAMAAEPLDLAVPLSLFTVAYGDRPRRTVTAAFATALCGALALSVLQPVLPTRTPQSLAPAGSIPVTATGPIAKPVPFPKASLSQLMVAALWQSVGVLLVLALAYLLGANLRGRRIHLHTLERRAADLEREQRQRMALATAAERARITRELHDVVAHGLSVMVVQAQGGAAALRRHPERAEAALQQVIATGRASLAEMRRLLAVVRQDPVEEAELAPSPGVRALPDLVHRVQAAGSRITFTIEGDPVPLPSAVDLCAYRLVQEALTNVLKHAGDGASAAVRLEFHPESLAIEVRDDGTGTRTGTDGNGLRGIGERVTMLGGQLIVGPREPGGFRVWARLPLREDG